MCIYTRDLFPVEWEWKCGVYELHYFSSFTNRQALLQNARLKARLVFTPKKDLVLLGLSIWDAAVVHSDWIFPYLLQYPGHKLIKQCLVSISLHSLCSTEYDTWEPCWCVSIAVLSTNEIPWPAPETVLTHCCNCLHRLSLTACHAMSACVKNGVMFVCRPCLMSGGDDGIFLPLSSFPVESHSQQAWLVFTFQ